MGRGVATEGVTVTVEVEAAPADPPPSQPPPDLAHTGAGLLMLLGLAAALLAAGLLFRRAATRLREERS
jgi:hypothetical protein